MYRWNDDLCIGHSVIDHQHRELFRIAEKVETLMDECKPNLTRVKNTDRQQRVLRETIKYLKSYAKEHLATEEALQRELGYEGYEAHKKIHDDFTVTIEQIEKRVYEDGCGDECVEKFLDWFSAWLYNHIMYEDQRIIKKEK